MGEPRIRPATHACGLTAGSSRAWAGSKACVSQVVARVLVVTTASRWRWPVVVGVAVLLLALLLLRRPLADWLWPETRAQASARPGRAWRWRTAISAPADGSGARELYEAALALDPDRDEARAGLMRVAQAALAQARSAIAAERYADAHRALQLANATVGAAGAGRCGGDATARA